MEVAAARLRTVGFCWHDPGPGLAALAHPGGVLVRWQVGSVLGRARHGTATTPGPTSSVHGAEAGGYVRGHTALPPPLESVLDEVDVPVLAAGGVGTAPRRGRGAHRRSRLSRRIRVGTRIEAMALYTDEAVAAVTEVRGAAVVVRELAEGAERLLAR
ncbi:hypothetical protein BAY59_11730 [Prauserella coralliicola]|nr:hypothetical protein BAY59_11730 [Prauserella coralliicola]